MSVAHKLFLDLPAPKKLVVMLWLFLVVVVGLLALSYMTIENLSAARAYVGGEGLWSKGRSRPSTTCCATQSRTRKEISKPIKRRFSCRWETGKRAWSWKSLFRT